VSKRKTLAIRPVARRLPVGTLVAEHRAVP
jgi:hypothetical protein